MEFTTSSETSVNMQLGCLNSPDLTPSSNISCMVDVEQDHTCRSQGLEGNGPGSNMSDDALQLRTSTAKPTRFGHLSPSLKGVDPDHSNVQHFLLQLHCFVAPELPFQLLHPSLQFLIAFPQPHNGLPEAFFSCFSRFDEPVSSMKLLGQLFQAAQDRRRGRMCAG